MGSPFVRYGDWQRWYPGAHVIQQISGRGKEEQAPLTVVLVRTGDTSAPARTLYIDLEKGGILIVNSESFESKDLKLARLDTNPLKDGSLN